MNWRNAMLGLGLGLSMVACSTSPRPPDGTPDAGGALTWVTVPASDSRVQYTGRTYTSTTGVVFSLPGVTMRVRFQGDAVRMVLDDGGTGGDTGTNYFNVSIDGAPPTLLEARSGRAVYTLAAGLTPGEHTVEVLKRTETSVGASTLVELEIHGELREPPARPALRMEFIGDSITCGYGTEVSLIPDSPSWQAPTFTSKNEDPTLTYGWLTARSLGAEVVNVCYSGHGVYRNLDMSTSDLVPAIYEVAVPGQPAAWDFSRYTPDVIVINAGTNDVFAGHGTPAYLPDETAFKAAYRRFLTRLRTLYPRTHIVCTLGGMTDGFKEERVNGTVRSVHLGEWITQLVAERNGAGDARVYRHSMAVQNPQADGVGEDWHPSATTHQKLATSLTRFLQETVLR
jgi:lysophospholipase L1-like esterase